MGVITVFVKEWGDTSRPHEFSPDDSWTVWRFKQHIESTVRIEASDQRLNYKGTDLQDSRRLSDYLDDRALVYILKYRN